MSDVTDRIHLEYGAAGSGLPMNPHFSVHQSICWRITRHCNRACGFCLSRSGPKYGHPSLDPFSTLERLCELGVRKLSYTGGEPLLFPEMGRLVATARSRSVLQVITTNGDALHTARPRWLRLLEHLNLSFYGNVLGHDQKMGTGNYLSLMRLARDLASDGIVVSANYLLTWESLKHVSEFLRLAISHTINDVTFQTYIPNGRARSDRVNRSGDSAELAQAVQRYTAPFEGAFRGKIKLHDFNRDYWYVVLDTYGFLTLPRAGLSDFNMGHISSDHLELPDRSALPAAAALEVIWDRKAYGPGIVAL